MKSKNITIAIFIILSIIPSYPVIVSLLNTFTVYGVKDLFKMVFLAASYITIASILWQNKYLRLFALVMLILWMINTSITLILFCLFDSSLDAQLAMTILCSNANESQNFIQLYWHLILLIFLIFAILCFCVNQLSKQLSKKTLIILSSILLLTVSYKTTELVIKGKLKEPNFLLSERLFPYMSLGNYSILIRSYEDMRILSHVDKNKPIYELTTLESNIDTYILILGESARRDHVSLYGYTRPTTPNMEKRRDEMFIFEQAISAAPITTMALTTALSVKPVDSNNFLLLGDNVVNLANQAGFKTYWYSLQRPLGQYNTVITSIAEMANHLEWLDITKHDDIFISKIEEALNDVVPNKQKKLIIIHTNGSHFVACNQYPEEEKYFSGGESIVADCYDDSIRFTDKIIEQIYTMVEDHPASVFYFSDHGQVRRLKRGELDYFHGSVNPSKESIEVPQFIWYSSHVSEREKNLGSYAPVYSTAGNYYLLANWLGITHINSQEVISPLIGSYQPENNFLIMDTRGNKFYYNQMRSDKEIGLK